MTFPQRASVRRAYGGMCKTMWTDAEDAAKPWQEVGDQLHRYSTAKDYAFEYQSLNPNAWFKAKVGKTEQAMQELGPRLAPLSDVTRLLRPRTADPGLALRTEARAAYLNYTPTQTRFIHQRRQAVNDALCWGGGTLWTGLDERTKLVTSIWDPRLRTLVDADAKMYEDVRVIFRKRIRPRAEVMRAYPDAAEVIQKIKGYDGDGDKDGGKDRICYRECWFNHGITQYQGGSEAIAAASESGAMNDKQKREAILSGKDEPVLCLVTEDGDLFDAGPWPIPFYKLTHDGWPVTFYDLYTGTTPVRPHSPLAPGLGVQCAINHIVTLSMSRARTSFRAAFATRKQNGKGLSVQARDRLMNGADITIFEVDFGAVTDGQMKIKDFIEQIDFGTDWIGNAIAYTNFLESLYERLTPLSQFLSTGGAPVQDRSAEATRVRDRNSMMRVEDLKDMVTDADTAIAAKEAYAAGRMVNAEDLAVMLPEAAQGWGTLVSTPEAKKPEYWIAQLSAGQEWLAQDPMVIEEAMRLAADAFTEEELIYQTDFEIEASSSRRKDVDQQIASLDGEANTTWPLLLQNPDPFIQAQAVDGMAIKAKLIGLPKSYVAGLESVAARLRATPPMPDPNAIPPDESTMIQRDASGNMIGFG